MSSVTIVLVASAVAVRTASITDDDPELAPPLEDDPRAHGLMRHLS
jgi:hypothetical protein